MIIVKKLSIILVNYRVKYFLEQALLSVRAAVSPACDAEIFVVDNHSGDDSMAYLKPRFPEVTFIENQENSGFAKANNQAIARSTGEYILLLNPDTVIGENTLTEVCQFMDSHPDAGGLGVKMLNGEGRFLPESKRGFPSPWTSFCKIFGLAALAPHSRLFGKYHLRYLSENEIHPVDILSGAFMLLRKTAIERCGVLDETFFMYGEDIDLSYRITLAGYKNYYLPTPIIHYKGESTKKYTLKYVRIFYGAMLIFFKKHYPHYRIFYALLIKSAIALRALYDLTVQWIGFPFRYWKKRRLSARQIHWHIISEFPDRIRSVIAAHYPEAAVSVYRHAQQVFDNATTQPNTSDRIVFDRGSMCYDDIIRTIGNHSRKGRDFYIYSPDSGIIVSSQEILKS